MPTPIDPKHLILDNYPRVITIEPRYSDMDTNAHLNNGAIGTYYENARAHMLIYLFQRPDHFSAQAPDRTILAEITLRYLAEGSFPEPVTVGSAIGHIGNSSFSMVQALFQKDRCIGVAETTMVYQIGGKSAPITGELRERFISQQIAG